MINNTATAITTIPVHALTLKHPWAEMIISGVKDVENRSWAPRAPLPFRFWVHSGKGMDRKASQMALHHLPSVILGVVTVVDLLKDESESEWALPGMWHWVLADPVRLDEPVPCRGAQSLWRPPIDVLTKAGVQLANMC